MPKRRRWHAVQSSATEHSRATNSAPPCSDSQPPPCSDSQPEYARWRAVSPERTATEHSCAQSGRLDPDIRLQKCMNPAAVRLKTHHNRSPDVGIGILIYMPNNRAGTGEVPEMIEYYGEYLGHGQSKTAFELNCPDAPFHGKVLKVAGANNMEPSVFMEASKSGLTTRILYNCTGIDADSRRRFHCWITERTIPLDEFCRYSGAIKSRCTLAAFRCILRATQHGLYLSDSHFFNFGVRLTESATEHFVVIIDAGSRGIDTEAQWKKSEINTRVMKKFWKACASESATNTDIQRMWRNENTEHGHKNCLDAATRSWQSSPILTEPQELPCAIWQAMIADNAFHRSLAQATSAYKIMEIVGRFTAEDQWSAACALECYRASKTMNKLSVMEYQILDELYQRITYCRVKDEDLHDVMVFWGELHEYREHERRRMLQSSERQSVTPEQATQMLESFKYHQLWYDLTRTQQQSNSWRSTLNTVLHKRAGWTHAARAIMEYGLPRLEQPAQSDDATEHINALGQFAQDLAGWLQGFASRMHAYRLTDEYQKNYETSINALEHRRKRAAESG